jgi:hypothetical protein
MRRATLHSACPPALLHLHAAVSLRPACDLDT